MQPSQTYHNDILLNTVCARIKKKKGPDSPAVLKGNENISLVTFVIIGHYQSNSLWRVNKIKLPTLGDWGQRVLETNCSLPPKIHMGPYSPVSRLVCCLFVNQQWQQKGRNNNNKAQDSIWHCVLFKLGSTSQSQTNNINVPNTQSDTRAIRHTTRGEITLCHSYRFWLKARETSESPSFWGSVPSAANSRALSKSGMWTIYILDNEPLRASCHSDTSPVSRKRVSAKCLQTFTSNFIWGMFLTDDLRMDSWG